MPMTWGYAPSEQHGEAAVRAVHAALDAGATLLDTADAYGPFTNELLLGRVLKERRGDAFVAAKCGLLVGERHLVANGSPAYIRRACDASLRRLQTDVIDLYQLHRPDPEVPVEDTWGAMAELVTAGKVRALGVCALDRPYSRGTPSGAGAGSRAGAARPPVLRLLERLQQIFPVSSVQAELSVWAQRARTELLPWCEAHGVGLLAAMPLGRGFLTGTLTTGGGFEAGDLRAADPRFTAEMMAVNQPVVAGLRRVAARHPGATPAQAALAWLLALSPVVIPVPGSKKERWVRENCAADGLRLTPADVHELTCLPPAQSSWD